MNSLNKSRWGSFRCFAKLEVLLPWVWRLRLHRLHNGFCGLMITPRSSASYAKYFHTRLFVPSRWGSCCSHSCHLPQVIFVMPTMWRSTCSWPTTSECKLDWNTLRRILPPSVSEEEQHDSNTGIGASGTSKIWASSEIWHFRIESYRKYRFSWHP